MIRLKAHSRSVGKLNEIDKLLLIPKKNWDDFPVGEGEYKLNSKKLKLRVYDVPCDCSGEDHVHRIVDLREVWNNLALQEGTSLEVER